MVEEQQENESLELPFHPLTLLFRLRARWKLFLALLGISVSLGIALALSVGSRVYQAEAVLHYRPSEAERTPPNLLTLLNMVKLPENLRAVREKLNLPLSLTALSRAYKIDVRRDTELLIIQATAETPEKAVQYVTSLRDVFLESQEIKRRQKLQAAAVALEERLETVASELKKADTALQDFTVEHRIVDLDKEAQWYLEELTSLQIMLEEAQVKRTSVKQQAENIDRIVSELKEKVAREKAESQTEFDSLGDINIRVQRLRAAIHDDKTQRSGEALLKQKRLELDRAEALRAKGLLSQSEFDKKLAAYQSQEALTVDTDQVAEWKNQVEELNAKAIPNTGQQAQSGPILQEMMLKAFEIQLELVTQDKRVAGVEEAVAKARKRLDALPQLQREFAALQRELHAVEEQKKDLEQRLGDTRRLLSSRLKDFLIASEPLTQTEPVSSNRRTLALAGSVLLLGGTFLGIVGLEVLTPFALSAPELRQKTSMDVFGTMPAQSTTPSGVENLLARRLPQKGTYVVTTMNSMPKVTDYLQRIVATLHHQGVESVVRDLREHPPRYFRSPEFQQQIRESTTSSKLLLLLTDSLAQSVSPDILAEQTDGTLILVETTTSLSGARTALKRLDEETTGMILCGVEKPFERLN